MKQKATFINNAFKHPPGTDALVGFSVQSIKIMKVMLGAVMCASVLAVVYGFLSGHSEQLILSVVLTLVVVGVCYWELNKGRIDRAVNVFCWGFWLYACVFSLQVAGIHTPILFLIPPVIMIVGWSQGRIAVLVMLSLTTLFFISYVVAENYHWLPDAIHRTAMSMFITYMCIIFNAGIISLVIAENFTRLVKNSKKLTRDLQRRLHELKQSDEALRNLNNRLEQRVADRTALFDSTNQSLQNTVARLELAQKELVQSEKLASLGSLVAGISHELNTPVGNALTMTTSLENLFQQFSESISAGNIKRSDLEELIQTGIEMSALATRSTRRAVDLMASFKQVAVDQTSEKRRNFNLYNVIEDNLATLLPNIKKQHKAIRITNQVGTHIQCDSYPGPLGQIILNLTQNAILHGFDGKDAGTVTIVVEEKNEMIVLSISDDGIGMEPAVMVHVFDPFFTTKLGRGGSGIGLSVSYRIATSILGGNLSVVSAPGKGASFTLSMPKVAPFKF